MRDRLVARAARTGATLWFFYLGAKIFEQLNKSHRHAVARLFVDWINKCDEQVTSALNPNLSAEELEIHLLGLLEVSLVHHTYPQHNVPTQLLARILKVRSNQHTSRLLSPPPFCPCFHRLGIQRL